MERNSYYETFSHKSLEIICWILPLLAIFLTILRLYERAKKYKLWWDDFWALVGLFCNAATMIMFEMHAMNIRTMSISRSMLVHLYYAKTLLYYSAVMTARLSILFTVIRIFPFSNIRIVLGCLATSLVFAWLILMAQTFWHCENQRGWVEEKWPQCYGGNVVAIPQIFVAIITDAVLILLPLRLFWCTNLAQRIRLTITFASTAIFTTVSLYHSYAVRDAGPVTESVAATIEFSVGLMVANLTVLIGWLFRLKNDDCENNGANYPRSALLFRSRHTTSFSITSSDISTPQARDSAITIVNINSDASSNPEELKRSEMTKTIQLSVLQEENNSRVFKLESV